MKEVRRALCIHGQLSGGYEICALLELILSEL